MGSYFSMLLGLYLDIRCFLAKPSPRGQVPVKAMTTLSGSIEGT
jgi:hypothetical protein